MILSSLIRTHGLSLSGEAFCIFMAEVVAVLNSQPLTVGNLSNPDDPSPLCSSQLITLKSKVILPPPGQFLPEDIYSRKQWKRIQHLGNKFGQDGARSTCSHYKFVQSGTIKSEI